MPKPIIETKLPSMVPQGSANIISDNLYTGVSASGGSHKFRELAQGLRGLDKAVDSYLTLQETQAKINAQMGELDKQMGKPPKAPNSFSNLGWGYNAGYSMMAGEEAGRKIATEYEAALARNDFFSNEPDAQVAAKKRQEILSGITQKHLSGAPLAMVAGASNKITKVAGDGEDIALKVHNERRLTSVLNMSRETIRASTLGMIKDIADKRQAGVDVDYTKMRGLLSSQRVDLETQGLSPKMASEIVLDQYGQQIIEMARGGMPLSTVDTLLNNLHIKDNGFSWIDYSEPGPNGSVVFPYRQRIEEIIRDAHEVYREREASNIAEGKSLKEAYEAKITMQITTGQDFYGTMMEGLKAHVDLDPEKYARMAKNLSPINAPFVVDNPAIASSLRHRAANDSNFEYRDYEARIGVDVSSELANELTRIVTLRKTNSREAQSLSLAGDQRDLALRKETLDRRDRQSDAAWYDALAARRSGTGPLAKAPTTEFPVLREMFTATYKNHPGDDKAASQAGLEIVDRYLNSNATRVPTPGVKSDKSPESKGTPVPLTSFWEQSPIAPKESTNAFKNALPISRTGVNSSGGTPK